ncbi:hypothetical protein RF11_15735 [Thelohanellus kitauei]|uniref:Uncharacterized protein n=1 Tax=Thelohanellus kitauei TaxID=669202 RepID=A0A0C2N0R1_THEKT|nr:hypothetical protein RF11_15735 [Thelohanellus kitauei]
MGNPVQDFHSDLFSEYKELFEVITQVKSRTIDLVYLETISDILTNYPNLHSDVFTLFSRYLIEPSDSSPSLILLCLFTAEKVIKAGYCEAIKPVKRRLLGLNEFSVFNHLLVKIKWLKFVGLMCQLDETVEVCKISRTIDDLFEENNVYIQKHLYDFLTIVNFKDHLPEKLSGLNAENLLSEDFVTFFLRFDPSILLKFFPDNNVSELITLLMKSYQKEHIEFLCLLISAICVDSNRWSYLSDSLVQFFTESNVHKATKLVVLLLNRCLTHQKIISEVLIFHLLNLFDFIYNICVPNKVVPQDLLKNLDLINFLCHVVKMDCFLNKIKDIAEVFALVPWVSGAKADKYFYITEFLLRCLKYDHFQRVHDVLFQYLNNHEINQYVRCHSFKVLISTLIKCSIKNTESREKLETYLLGLLSDNPRCFSLVHILESCGQELDDGMKSQFSKVFSACHRLIESSIENSLFFDFQFFDYAKYIRFVIENGIIDKVSYLYTFKKCES